MVAVKIDTGWSDAGSITIFGKDFINDTLGRVNLGNMGFPELTGQMPDETEPLIFEILKLFMKFKNLVDS